MARQSIGVLRRVIRSVVKGDRPEVTDRELLQRFAADDDQEAFATLVARHGGMVLGVCRRGVPTVQDAEDAVQATFLVLARKAGTVRWQPSVANWLYTTARRVARDALVIAQRRARREARAAVPEAVQPVDSMTVRELLAVLDAELDKLPPRYREPLVLCYLEGLTRDEAAARLGLPPATLRTRLDRARKRLHDALTKGGCALGVGLLAFTVSSRAGASPPRLVKAILAAASGAAPEAVADLARGVAMNGLVNKSVLALAAVVAVVALGVGLGSLNSDAAGPPADRPGVPRDQAREKKDAAETIGYRGRILGPDGNPVSGAKVYLTYAVSHRTHPDPAAEHATTGTDGRFEFTVPRAKYDERWTVVAATAAGHGPGWVRVRDGGTDGNLTLRLVKDDVPITGQIVDLEGKPVPNAMLRVLQINAAVDEDLGPWLEAARARKGMVLELEQQFLSRYTVAVSTVVKADAEGRFRLTGVGRDRLVRLMLEGPTVATQELHVLTRPVKPVDVVSRKSDPEYGEQGVMTTYHGSDFRFVAAPSRLIVGVVRDKDTKKPLAGVTIRSDKLGNNPFHGRDIIRTTTDAEGRFKLTGMPKAAGSKILALPERDQPYLPAGKDVPDQLGFDPVTVDFELKHGIWIEGKVTDKVTGKGLKASVEYYAMYDNPHLRDCPDFEGSVTASKATREDGSYRVVGLPGPGLVGVYYHKLPYLRADERDDEFGTKEKSLLTAPFYLGFTSNYNAIARIDPAKDVKSVTHDVTCDPGWTFKATVQGPDGKLLSGAKTFNWNADRTWEREPMKTAEFVGGFKSRSSEDIVVRHSEKGLVGVAKPPAENGGSVTVRLEPGAMISGRLVDADGRPRPGVELDLSFRPKGWKIWQEYWPDRVTTNREGRFRIEGLLPGYEFQLGGERGAVLFGDGLRSGETKDLGDVKE